jgi:hypothetical protein
VMAFTNLPHPVETAQRSSRRTHAVDPTLCIFQGGRGGAPPKYR